MNYDFLARRYYGNNSALGVNRFVVNHSEIVKRLSFKGGQSTSTPHEKTIEDVAVGNIAFLKHARCQQSEKKSLVQRETERLQGTSLGLSSAHAKLISVTVRDKQPVYVLRGRSKMRLRLENKPVKVVEYQPGQHIQIDNTLYKVTPDRTLVQISENAALVNKLCIEGLGNIHCSQGSLPNCNSLAQLMAVFNDPTGHLIREVLSRFSEKVIKTKNGPMDCFVVRFDDFEVQIPKKDIRRSVKLGFIPFFSSDETFANARSKFKARHPLMAQVGRPLFVLGEKIIKRYAKEDFSWVKGEFKTNHGVDGTLLVSLFEKAFHEVKGMHEYEQAYKMLNGGWYPNTRTIEPGFNQREDVIAVVDRAVQSLGWKPDPHRLDRTHSIRAQRNADWLPRQAYAFWDFLTLGSNQQRNFPYTSKFPFLQTIFSPNYCYRDTWEMPTGKLAKFQLDAWKNDSDKSFQQALDNMYHSRQANWMQNLKAFLKVRASEGAGVMVIATRPSKDHIEEIEKQIELIPSPDTQKAKGGDAKRRPKPDTVSVNHAFIVDKVEYDADTDTYSFKIRDPHNTKKPRTITWENFLKNYHRLTYFEYVPNPTIVNQVV